MTSCPTYDYYKQNCTVFSPESNVLLIHKNRGSANSEEGMKLYDHGLSDSSEVLSSFRSITQISPLSYDLLTFTPENFKERKLNSDNQQRFRKERNTKNKQKIANYNENSRHCDFRNSRTNVTISSSAEISFAEDYPIHHEYTRKRKRKTCDEKYVCERMRNRWKARYMCTCHRRLYEKILPETSSSSSHVYERKPENMHEQFYRVFRLKNLKKFPSSKNNRQMGCEKKNTSDHSDNDCLCRKCAFMFLTRNYKNYVNDVDLDFKLTLLRYVELCKNVKRALMRITNYSN
ncbi:uncharacterized protein LOC113563067 [Ooceraea biroi]|uniref:uncharacterized protein LOC113563067 n=1 Tax=Ooceraea biroi TaxID=2015173 RepID=UPI000F0978C3|nr:uncharacterized protein LOC113563067 [Ooceraea biroi]